MGTMTEEFEKWWAKAPYCVSTTSAARAAWQGRQPEIDAANARIKQLEDANQALIAERDQAKHVASALAAELAELNAQEPVAFGSKCLSTGKMGIYIWHDESDVAGWVNLQHMSRDDCTYSNPISLYAKPIPPAIPEGYVMINIEQFTDLVSDNLFNTIGDAYDCTRVWSAWSYGTMTQDDFVPLSERIDEFVESAIQAMIAASQKGGA